MRGLECESHVLCSVGYCGLDCVILMTRSYQERYHLLHCPDRLYTLHSTLYTLHSTLYTLHSSLYTLRSTLCTLYREQFKIECYIIDPGLTPLDTPLDSSLTEIIFHSLGKLLCKIIFVYYKLHRPTVILGVLSLTVVLLQSLCSFCTNNDMKRENWTLDTAHSDQKHSQLVMVFLMSGLLSG